MPSQLEALRLFVRVARLGNFSRAARDLCLSQPKTSRVISQLERDVGTVLFLRTTRSVSLTDAGKEYLARIEPIIAALDEANRSVRQSNELRGELRMAAPSSIATRLVLPLLPCFLKRHEALHVELVVEEDVRDPVTRGFDAVIRSTVKRDWPESAVPLRAWPRLLVASPELFRDGGIPASPPDLQQFGLLSEHAGRGESWTLRRGQQRVALSGRRQLSVSEGEGLVAAAVAGAGVLATIAPACQREIESGSLVRVLADWDFGNILVYAQLMGTRPTAAARGLVRYLRGRLREVDVDDELEAVPPS
jgi:DNA-binding transcriptional LysR family regulator